MRDLLRTIISTFVLVIQGLVLYSIGYSAFDWQWWVIVICTVLYMFIYIILK